MTSLASVTIDPDNEVVIARIEGEIDTTNVSDVERMLTAGVAEGALGLVVDLTAVSYFNSTTIKMLFDLSERLRLRGQELRVSINNEAPMREIMRLVKFERLIALHPTSEEARGAICANRGR